MLTENTVNKLYEMRLTAMAKAFKDQMTDPNISKMSFEDRFGLLVDQEWSSRKNNHLKRLIKQAKFAETQRESLVAGDVIETVGGIIGKIVTVNNNSGEREFIIETGEEGRRTTLTVDAKALYRVISQQNPPPDPKAAKKNKSEQA